MVMMMMKILGIFIRSIMVFVTTIVSSSSPDNGVGELLLFFKENVAKTSPQVFILNLVFFLVH